MEQGRTEILNQALMYMGQDQILDPDGESKNAKLCASVYDDALAEALSEHPWSFARKVAKLQQLEAVPKDFRFAYSYQLPDDTGRILSVQCRSAYDNWFTETGRANTDPVAEYTVYGKELYSNQNDLQIVYVRNSVRPSEMTAQFRNYLAMCIALKLVLKVTGSNEGFQVLMKRVPMAQMEAKRVDSEQTDTMPENRPNLFVAARLY